MRHGMANRKLGRTSSHRKALFRNQLASMIESERIVTTLIKAKELRPLIERMVTLGKDDTVHHRRQAAQSVSDETLVKKLFTEISPRFNERPGGYTRIIKLGPRRGDGAEMAILEFVDYQLEGEKKAEPETKRGGSKKKAEAASSEEAPKKARGGSKKAAATGEGEGEAPKKRAPRKKKEE